MLISSVMLANLFAQPKGRFLVDTFRIPNWPSIHSFAYGVYGDEVLFIGGREDGIHGKENGFESAHANKRFYLWNTHSMNVTAFDVSFLDEEQSGFLSAANTAFAQSGNNLFILGGYGQLPSGNFVTYPYLVKIDLEKCIQALKKKQSPLLSMHWIKDSLFAVAGAQMKVKDSTIFLVGGNYFEGKYSSNSSLTKQVYTDAYYQIQWHEQVDTFYHRLLFTKKDDYNFHRRDFNLSTILDEDRKLKLMVYAGVFQYNLNKPFLNTSLIDDQQVEEIFDFDQKYCAYNCSRIGLYDNAANVYHQLFFGGMAENFRDSAGQPVFDAYVPFVKSISCVTRDETGKFHEYLLADEMPGFFGSNAEFIPNTSLSMLHPEIISLDQLNSDTSLIGYVFGGIFNPKVDRNPWQNDSAHVTKANPYVLSVRYVKNTANSVKNFRNNKKIYQFEVTPSPDRSLVSLNILPNEDVRQCTVWIQQLDGKIIHTQQFKQHPNFPLDISVKDLPYGMYIVYMLINDDTLMRQSFQHIH